MLSIDIGIKNLSFCLFDCETPLKIIKWDNIDLSEKNESKCIEVDKKGLCDKPAKFVKDNKCYCLKHSKKQTWLQPCTDLKPSYLNKQNLIVRNQKATRPWQHIVDVLSNITKVIEKTYYKKKYQVAQMKNVGQIN